MAALSSVPARAHLAVFARSFALQGSWNYRTMVGQGFAFALLPALRHVHRGDPEGLERALERHSAHFNAHPYLAELVLGAVVRMEADGSDPETIRQFKSAVRGPLGGLGDRLVWVGALPAASLAGLAAAVAGAPTWLPPLLFLAGYNGAHLALRVWAYRAGVQDGFGVARRLRDARLSKLAGWTTGAGTALLGLLAGLAGASAVSGGGGAGALGVAAAAGIALVGARRGHEVWRQGVLLTVVVVSAVLLAGATG